MFPLVSDPNGWLLFAAIFCLIGVGLLVIALVIIRRPKKNSADIASGPDGESSTSGDPRSDAARNDKLDTHPNADINSDDSQSSGTKGRHLR